MQNIFRHVRTTATNPRFIGGSIAFGAGFVAFRVVSNYRRNAKTANNLRQHFADQARQNTETLRGFELTAEQAATLQDAPSVALQVPTTGADRQPGLTPETATMEAPFIQG